MSLARQIEIIEEFDALSQQTKDTALREIIDSYRKQVFKMGVEFKRIGYEYPYDPAIEKVIAGETTFMKEFEHLGGYKFLIQGNMEITGGSFDMEPQIEIVDKAIQRLYRK